MGRNGKIPDKLFENDGGKLLVIEGRSIAGTDSFILVFEIIKDIRPLLKKILEVEKMV